MFCTHYTQIDMHKSLVCLQYLEHERWFSVPHNKATRWMDLFNLTKAIKVLYFEYYIYRINVVNCPRNSFFAHGVKPICNLQSQPLCS